MKVITKNINWKTYKVDQDTPLVVAVHICSTKIPYKSVGKEFIADQPEVEKEITNAIREAARDLRIFISRSYKLERQRHRLNIFSKYLPVIAEFAQKLAERTDLPQVQKLLDEVNTEKTDSEEIDEEENGNIDNGELPELEVELEETEEILEDGEG